MVTDISGDLLFLMCTTKVKLNYDKIEKTYGKKKTDEIRFCQGEKK